MIVPCLISTGQISSKGCVRENTTGKFVLLCNCNLLPSNDVYLQISITILFMHILNCHNRSFLKIKIYLISDIGTCVFSNKIPYLVDQTADTYNIMV